MRSSERPIVYWVLREGTCAFGPLSLYLGKASKKIGVAALGSRYWAVAASAAGYLLADHLPVCLASSPRVLGVSPWAVAVQELSGA